MNVAGRFFTAVPTVVEAISADDRLALGTAGPGEHRADGRTLLYDMSPGSIDVSLVKAGRCPFLCEHIRSIGTRLGTVVAAVPEDGALRLAVRFARNGAAADLWDQLLDGHLVSLSVGIHILAAEQPDDGPARVTRWRLEEVSAVCLGHDPGAHLHARTTDEHVLELIRQMDGCDYGRRLQVRRRYGLDDWQRWAGNEGGAELAHRLGVGLAAATDALATLVDARVRDIEGAMAA